MAKEKNSKCHLIYFLSSHIPIITNYEDMKKIVKNNSIHSSYILAEVIFFMFITATGKQVDLSSFLFFLKEHQWFNLHPIFVQLIVLS
jgi:hypothetical protein